MLLFADGNVFLSFDFEKSGTLTLTSGVIFD
jgi:hypothetical protein